MPENALTTRPVPKNPKGNRIVVSGDVAIIFCRSRGIRFSVIADAADLDLLQQYTWHVSWQSQNPRNIYATTVVHQKGKTLNFRMHRLLLGTADKVDHQNGRGTDNRRRNLRNATGSQNNANMRRAKSGFKGVSKSCGSFSARIKINQKLIHIGTFPTAQAAALAYDKKAVEAFGEYAKTNF